MEQKKDLSSYDLLQIRRRVKACQRGEDDAIKGNSTFTHVVSRCAWTSIQADFGEVSQESRLPAYLSTAVFNHQRRSVDNDL